MRLASPLVRQGFSGAGICNLLYGTVVSIISLANTKLPLNKGASEIDLQLEEKMNLKSTTRTIAAMAFFTLTATQAVAFPTGNFSNKFGGLHVTNAENGYIVFGIIASTDNARFCEINGLAQEVLPGVLQGKTYTGNSIKITTKKNSIVLKTEDDAVCSNGLVISGSYEKMTK
jgi:hypothetical protein